jgi:hypothetical protein
MTIYRSYESTFSRNLFSVKHRKSTAFAFAGDEDKSGFFGNSPVIQATKRKSYEAFLRVLLMPSIICIYTIKLTLG